jgi:hypothetical protein
MSNYYNEIDETVISYLAFTEERNERIKNEVCSIFKLKWCAVQSKSRTLPVMEARRLYCVVLRRIFNLPLATIGKFVNTNHATVIHAVKKHDVFSEVYPSYNRNFDRIKSKLIDENCPEFYEDELIFLKRKKKRIQEQIDNLIITKKIN